MNNPLNRRWLRLAPAAILFFLLAGCCCGPRAHTISGCQICGRTREVDTRWGFIVRDRVTESPLSQWVDVSIPGHTAHVWEMGSYCRAWIYIGTSDNSLFARGVCADATPQGRAILHSLWRMRPLIGDSNARALLATYHRMVTSNTPAEREELSRRILMDGEPLADVLSGKPPALGISQVVESRDGRTSCWGVAILLDERAFSPRIAANQIKVTEAKHNADLTDLMSWSVSASGKRLAIMFKPGMGDFGSGNSVTVRVDAAAIQSDEGLDKTLEWTIRTDVAE